MGRESKGKGREGKGKKGREIKGGEGREWKGGEGLIYSPSRVQPWASQNLGPALSL